jgi:hypothetical protein
MSEPLIPSDPVFRVSGGMKVLVGVLLVPFALVVAGGAVWFAFNGPLTPGQTAVPLVAGFAFAAIFGCMVWSMLLTKIEILPEGMRFTRGFRADEEIPFDRIAGFRTLRGRNGTTLVIVPEDAPHRRIIVSRSLARRAELEGFIKGNLVDLDQADKDADMEAALADTQLGSTTEERRAALSRAQTHAYILNGTVFAAMVWAFLYPRPYAAVIIVLAFLPLAAVALAIFSHGAVSLYIANNSARPGVAGALIAPAFGLAVRALKDWHVIGWSGFWVPFAVLAALMVAVLWLASMSDAHKTTLAFLGLSAVCLAQSFGLVLFVNCYPDHTVPEIHRTVVRSRHITSGKSTTYHITIGPWLDGGYGRQITVDSSFYYAHSEGSTVLVGVRRGVLRMTWFFLR